MSKGLRAFFVFWMVWDIGFFVKNLIEGDLFFMAVFAVLACIQLGSYLFARNAIQKRDAVEAKIAADREKYRSQLKKQWSV